MIEVSAAVFSGVAVAEQSQGQAAHARVPNKAQPLAGCLNDQALCPRCSLPPARLITTSVEALKHKLLEILLVPASADAATGTLPSHQDRHCSRYSVQQQYPVTSASMQASSFRQCCRTAQSAAAGPKRVHTRAASVSTHQQVGNMRVDHS